MEEVTRILNAVESGEEAAAEELLPLLYNELRRLAASRISRERPGITLQATALVHEAYLRLLGPEGEGKCWKNRAHFFGAAAEAMRRILIDSARRRNSQKRPPNHVRVNLEDVDLAAEADGEEVLAVNDALERLKELDPTNAELVKLRFFAGLTIAEAAAALGFSEPTAKRRWAFARAWLKREITRPS